VSTTAATAIETVTVSGTTAVTVGTLGQSVVSTTASDYEVVLLGPTITRSSSVATAALWAFIGTVVGGGSPRTFDTSSQPAAVSLNEVSSAFSNLLAKGWVTRPTVGISGGGTTVDITSTGVVFTNGRVLATPTGASFTGLPATSDIWLSYNIIAGDVSLYTTWDTANAGTNVPLFWAKTDGGSLVTAADSASIGRMVEKFPETILMTLSGQATHQGAFTTIRSVLGYIGSLQDSATIPPRSARVEVIGKVTVTTAAGLIDDADFFDGINVHFVGAEGKATSTPAIGATFEWSVNATSLFEVPAGATMNGWTFEGINFIHTGTPSAATVAVVRNLGTVADLKFVGCNIGRGTLPAAYVSNGATSRLTFVDCQYEVTDVAIRQTVSATNGIAGLRVSGCRFIQSGAAVGADRGFIRDDSTGGVASNRWRVQDNEADLAGAFLICEEMDRCWVKDNDIIIRNVNLRAIDIGLTTANADVRRVWVHDNSVEYPGAALFTLQGAIQVRTGLGDRTTAGNLAGVFVHNNFVEGTGYAAGNGTGVHIGGQKHDGAMLTHNMVSRFTKGVEFGSTSLGAGQSCMMAGNIVEGGDRAYEVNNGVTSSAILCNIGRVQNNSATVMDCDCDEDVVMAGNVFDTTGVTTAIALLVDNDAHGLVVTGNVLSSNTAVDINGADNGCLSGNSVGGIVDFTVGSTSWAISGNRMGGNHDYHGGDGHILSGNHLVGDMANLGGDSVSVGNRMDGLSFNDTRLVMVGNLLTDAAGSINALGAAANLMAITGNIFRSPPGFNATSSDSALTGNVFENATAWSLDTNELALGGNLITAALTLAAGSNNIAAVGNRLNGGAITDAGTSNTVASNDI
jgi:hypothetical protein